MIQNVLSFLRNNKYLRFKMNKEDHGLITRWTIILQILFNWFLKSKLKQIDITEDNKVFLISSRLSRID